MLIKVASLLEPPAQYSATLLFLPPYSPELNPIEHDFAAFKNNREYDETASIDEIVKAYH